jgi:hypothetical protein
MSTIVCTTCGGPADAPYRDIVGGVVQWGCISAAHDAHADAWHNRPEAVAFRASGAETWGLLAPA